MLVSTRNKFDIARLKEMLSSEFDMNELIGSGRKILGMEINRDRAIGKLFLTHKSYIEKILCILPQIEDELAYMSRVPYANAVSCLLYAMVFARPDIAHAVSVLSRFMA